MSAMTRPRLLPALLLCCLAGACSSSLPPLPPWEPVAEPAADSVESVLFLAGDAGEAVEGLSPVLAHLEREVERWACGIGRDSAVAVVFLGDNVYPKGLHALGDPRYPEDVRRLRSQTSTVAGACARRHAASALFLAGNHDWGTEEGLDGLARVQNQEVHFSELREESGIRVGLYPEAGRLGPAVVDLGAGLRLVMLDTAWWLLSPAQDVEKFRMQAELLAALQGAGDRTVVIAAHHPFASAGPHGGLVPFWETFGVKYLLSRSGAWLQDLHSVAYADLLRRLREVFTLAGPPLIFAGGHEHSLQVLEAAGPTDPRHVLVSGAASKVSEVGAAPGMRFRHSSPGYMYLLVRRSGRIDLFVVAAPERFLHCRPGAAPDVERCMEQGVAAFETVYSARLR